MRSSPIFCNSHILLNRSFMWDLRSWSLCLNCSMPWYSHDFGSRCIGRSSNLELNIFDLDHIFFEEYQLIMTNKRGELLLDVR